MNKQIKVSEYTEALFFIGGRVPLHHGDVVVGEDDAVLHVVAGLVAAPYRPPGAVRVPPNGNKNVKKPGILVGSESDYCRT